VREIARRLGFVGEVQYRHSLSFSGGASYCFALSPRDDAIIVYAEAFLRDAARDDFSLEAIIAHECGHQRLYRHDRLQRIIPQEMSDITVEVLASLIGSLILENHHDSEMLVLKALSELVEHGMVLKDALRQVERILPQLEAIL
jgi:hypothetical protein